MLDWLHGQPFVWLVVVVFGVTYLVAAAISWVVLRLAVGENARTFKAVSPGLLPPLGVVFGLLVGFLAVQVWNDHGEAQTAVNREASALRSVVLLGGSFPTAQQARMRVTCLAGRGAPSGTCAPASLRRPKSGAAGDGRRTRDRP